MTKLFVVGFPRNMDEMQLAQLFGPYGDIILLTIVRDKFNSESKGFGFIQMDDQGALTAMETLNGYEIADRQLEVRIAEDKPQTVKPSFNKAKPAYVPVSRDIFSKKKRPRLTK